MTDSTTGGETIGVDVGPSMDELFGAVEEEPLERESVDRAVDERDEVEDRTASDVFEQFRREADGQADVDDVLGEESPDDIITGVADEEPTSTADELLDEDALEDLLLTGRRKADEFLWVDTGNVTDADETEPTGETEPEGVEVEDELAEPATDGASEEPATDDASSDGQGAVADEPAPADDVTDADSTGNDSVDCGEPGSDELDPEGAAGGEADAAEANASDVDDSESDEPAGTTDSESDEPAGTTDSESDEGGGEPDDDSSGLLGRVRSSLGL